MAKCDIAGPNICQTVEFGGSMNNFECIMWSGICTYYKGYNSDIYVQKNSQAEA
jgi:hypothetical protein